jgi:hypothetical protein
LRRFLALMFGLGLLGNVAAILIGPRMIHYWYEPPVAAGMPSAFNCTGALDYGISKLITLQLVTTIAGMAVGLVIAILLWRRSKRLAAAVPATVTPGPPKASAGV